MPGDEGSVDPTFLTATPAPASSSSNHVAALGDVTRILEQPRDERLANLERFARCMTVRFRRRRASQEEKDLQMLMPDSLAKNPDVWEYTACAICLCDFAEGEELRRVPCAGGHAFHPKCLRGWIERSNKTCPVCRGGPDGDGRSNKGSSGARFSADALAEFVTRRMRSTKTDFTISKSNHERADQVIQQLRQPMPCLKPVVDDSEEEAAPSPASKEKPTDLVCIFSARQAARKAERRMKKAAGHALALEPGSPRGRGAKDAGLH
eukprot:TRINITY_DN32941_c0_g1_i1.p1 TRINITY_DN32941_c0_g1~~TRINITY_DN32941_c0_g1_i1.p1  ORF type:complete len:265 (-),score=71.33 TRINITY_DN32941_c0_g1_i1:44-838(-)